MIHNASTRRVLVYEKSLRLPMLRLSLTCRTHSETSPIRVSPIRVAAYVLNNYSSLRWLFGTSAHNTTIVPVIPTNLQGFEISLSEMEWHALADSARTKVVVR